jgi:hypothetical protein
MRGCVSAGMIASVVSLGLMDTFDAVYGSSAGGLVSFQCGSHFTIVLHTAAMATIVLSKCCLAAFDASMCAVFCSR